MKLYQHILLAVDLSEECLPFAVRTQEMAKLLQTKLSLVHAIEPIHDYGYPGMFEVEELRMNNAKEALATLGEKLGIAATHQHWKVGSTPKVIITVAEEIGADLVVLGRHSHHGLAKLLGSTANAVNNGAHCDVLTLYVRGS